MRTKPLGRAGLQVSELCLGTMAFGSDADAAEAARMFRAARDAGIDFFDTADQYNAGKSEEILGQLIRGSRDDLVIATKGFNPTGSDVNARGANRRHVRRAVEASLKRLGTDRIDVRFHKVRYGDEWMHETAAKLVAFCKAREWHPITAAMAWVKISMTPELRAQITAFSRTPPPATDRNDEAVKA